MPISLNRLTVTAKDRRDILGEVVDRFAVRGEVAPDVVTRGLVHIRDTLKQRITICDHTFVVIGALGSAIVNLPGLLEVVRPYCCRRPYVALARYLTGVEKVVE